MARTAQTRAALTRLEDGIRLARQNLDVVRQTYELGRMTVTDVRGYGRQRGQTEMYQGKDAAVQFVNKVKLDVCVDDGMVDKAVEAILHAAGSGKIGDGKLFVYDVDKVIRIRTGEKDSAAL